ncbi:MAG: fluoride efflux transporter CrcB [Leptolyngbya sp. UWPOB_LEPTO1]|nr:fluoride efflux transporter CrcB [Leptolyngbya sp. UWPOB_LEPTO1]
MIVNVSSAIAISLGAIPGALSRYYLTLWFGRVFGVQFPYGTFFINITGAMLMGFFVAYFLDRGIGTPELRLFFAVGFLGSYTTFSTYALETSVLVKSGNHSLALLYWLGSAAIGYLGLEFGSFLARRLS